MRAYQVEVAFIADDGTGKLEPYVRNSRVYFTESAANRAAIRIECRNGANGVDCCARVVEVQVT